MLLAVAVLSALIGLPTSGTTGGAVGAPSQAARFVSPTGNDAGSCTQAAPCASLDRAYAVAQPGQTVDVAGGSYPEQNIMWRPGRDSAAQVVFRPTGQVTIQGNLRVFASGVHIAGQATGTVTDWRSRSYSIVVTRDMAVLGVDNSAAQYPHNVTLEGIDGGSLGTYSAENVTVRDIDAGPVVLDGSCSRPESKIGPNIDFSPRNITWERVVVHGMDRDASAAQANCHYGGLFIVSASGVTIRESVFTQNIVYNIQVQNFVGAPASDVTIQNSWFGCPVLAVYESASSVCNGQPSIQFNAASLFSDWLIRYNSFSGSQASNADGGRASFSNVRFVGNAGNRPASDVCGRSGVTFSMNAWIGATCGGSDKSIASPFVSDAAGAEDLHITAGSGAIDAGDPSNTSSSDIDGQSRPLGGGPDAGADERS